MGLLGIGHYSEHNKENPLFAAPKKGLARFFQLLSRDLWDYVKANLLFCLCLLPSAIAAGALLLVTSNYALSAGAALVCSIPVGGGLCGLHRVLNRSVRDLMEPCGRVFIQGFRENFAAALLPGMLQTVQLLLSFYMLLFHSAISAFPLSGRLWSLLVLCWVFLQILLQYCFPILILLKLPLRNLFRNSLILFFSDPKRSLPCFFLTTALHAAGVLLFPANFIIKLLFGFALTGLIQQLFSWQAIDTAFSVSKRQITQNTATTD